MNSVSATVRPGDERPVLGATLTDSTGLVVDLTGASVQLRVRGATVEFPAQTYPAQLTGNLGEVLFDWGATVGVPSADGVYFGHWLVTYINGDSETFPNSTNGFAFEVRSD